MTLSMPLNVLSDYNIRVSFRYVLTCMVHGGALRLWTRLRGFRVLGPNLKP